MFASNGTDMSALPLMQRDAEATNYTEIRSPYVTGPEDDTYFSRYRTSYSLPLGILCNVLVEISTVITVYLMYKRRKFFPLNVAPFWLQASTHVGVAVGILADTHPALFHAPNCIMFWLYYPILHWVPFVSGMLMLMWYVQASYVVQLIRARRKKPEEFFMKARPHLASMQPKWLAVQYTIMAVILSVPQIIAFNADYSFIGLDTKLCTFSSVIANALYYGQPFCAASTLLFLVIGLFRNVQEEFRLTKNIIMVVIAFSTTALPWRLFVILTTPTFPIDMVRHFKAIEIVTWWISFSAYNYFMGIEPWKLSLALGINAPEASIRGKVAPGEELATSRKTRSEVNSKKVANTGRLKMLLKQPQLATEFAAYCIKEFCIENMLFISILNDYCAATDLQTRVSIMRKMEEDFFADASLNQINVSMKLRKQTLQAMQTAVAVMAKQTDATATQAAEVTKIADDLLQQCEKEVLKMLLNPFNRCVDKNPQLLPYVEDKDATES